MIQSLEFGSSDFVDALWSIRIPVIVTEFPQEFFFIWIHVARHGWLFAFVLQEKKSREIAKETKEKVERERIIYWALVLLSGWYWASLKKAHIVVLSHLELRKEQNHLVGFSSSFRVKLGWSWKTQIVIFSGGKFGGLKTQTEHRDKIWRTYSSI